MIGVDVHSCPAVREHRYVMSKSNLRLLNGDACLNVSRIINDTDGRGHSTLPGRGIHLPPWAIVVIALLVSVFLSCSTCLSSLGGVIVMHFQVIVMLFQS